MNDVTQQFELCRETARHIWNSCFAHQTGEPTSGATLESFDRICEELFDALILTPFGSAESPSQLNVQGFVSIRVVPAIPEGTPVLINRTDPSGPYWDDPLKSILPDASQLGFIGFFDWDSHGMIDMRYLRVRILRCDANPVVVGREALIEMAHAKVVTSI